MAKAVYITPLAKRLKVGIDACLDCRKSVNLEVRRLL
jgi:hypothetical protein